MTRRFAAALLLATLGQAAAQDALQQLEDQLSRGLYNSAALVSGPALVEANPEDSRAWELYARALYLTGDVTGAREAVDTAVRLVPAAERPPSLLNLLGLVLAEEDELTAALPLLRQAATESGSYVYALDWGRIAWQAADLEQAEEAYLAASATARGQREPWPWLDVGRIRLIQGRLAEAEQAFEQAIAVYETFDTGTNLPSPAYVEAFYRLGQIGEQRFEQSGDPADFEQARVNYSNALVGDPNYGPALEALVRLEQMRP